MKWQPIETVPKNPRHQLGPRVLVYKPGEGVFEARAYQDGKYHDPIYFEWDGVGATHWMPLPEPPE